MPRGAATPFSTFIASCGRHRVLYVIQRCVRHGAVARGTIEDTRIDDHVKIDDHVFIAHNVQIGEGSFVIAGAEVSGSVQLGKRVWVAPQVTILNKVKVGDNATLGIGAVVRKDVEAGSTVAGNPARVLRKLDH